MSTNNPFAHHTNKLFASRGCDIDQAMSYANDVITAMPTEVQSHAMTALMVVVNTAANAFDQARGPSPEKLVVEALIREAVARELGDFDQRIRNWMDDNIDIDDAIQSWMNTNLEDEITIAVQDVIRNSVTVNIDII